MFNKPICFDESEPAAYPEVDWSVEAASPDYLTPDTRLSPREKLFLISLCGLARGRVRSWPTDRQIRETYNRKDSDKWIRKALAKLVELGWVEVEYPPSGEPLRVIVLPFFDPSWSPPEGMRPAIEICRSAESE